MKFPYPVCMPPFAHDFGASSLGSGPGHATCSGPWNIGKHDVSKDLKNTCARGCLLLISGILRMSCKKAGLAYQRDEETRGVGVGPPWDRGDLLPARNQGGHSRSSGFR